jgi:hypothetical protein
VIALAISYGLLTLITLWAGAGAHSDSIVTRAPIALLLYIALTVALVKVQKAEFYLKPFKLFTQKQDYLPATLIFALALISIVLLKFLMPVYFLDQSVALTHLSGLAAFAFVASLGLSDFVYRSLFSPAWGFASAAFLEALSWGLATQSFVFFIFIFATGWALSKTTHVTSVWGSVAIRLALGLAWIALV